MASPAAQLRLAQALGLVEVPEPAPEPGIERAVDFDGGAREPAPGPSDPLADHNQLMVELLLANQGNRNPPEEW